MSSTNNNFKRKSIKTTGLTEEFGCQKKQKRTSTTKSSTTDELLGHRRCCEEEEQQQQVVDLDVLGLVMEYLAPRELYRLAFSCKGLLSKVSIGLVVQSAMLVGGTPRETIQTLQPLLEHKRIFAPSSLRLLRLVNAKRCENCCSTKMITIRPQFGVVVCCDCVRSGPYTRTSPFGILPNGNARVNTIETILEDEEKTILANFPRGEILPSQQQHEHDGGGGGRSGNTSHHHFYCWDLHYYKPKSVQQQQQRQEEEEEGRGGEEEGELVGPILLHQQFIHLLVQKMRFGFTITTEDVEQILPVVVVPHSPSSNPNPQSSPNHQNNNNDTEEEKNYYKEFLDAIQKSKEKIKNKATKQDHQLKNNG